MVTEFEIFIFLVIFSRAEKVSEVGVELVFWVGVVGCGFLFGRVALWWGREGRGVRFFWV